MSFPLNEIEFKRNAVQPIECIKGGWELIRSQYWLFVGMAVVGIIIGSVVPMGILMGPMMCGIYLALFKVRRNEPIEFGLLFKGFDYFGDSVIATLLHMVPIMIIIIPAYVIFYISMLGMIAASNGEPNPAALLSLLGGFGIFWLVVMVVVIVMSVIFTFAYPLIVDRRLSGMNAVKLSIRAGFGNFWRLLGMLILTGLMTFVGVLFCYVGAFLVLPVSFAAISVAYEQVFGLGQVEPHLPPPPPLFS
jgi:uncharacterized membrane protein